MSKLLTYRKYGNTVYMKIHTKIRLLEDYPSLSEKEAKDCKKLSPEGTFIVQVVSLIIIYIV